MQNHNEIWVMLLIFIVLRGMMGGFFAAIPVANSALIADHYQPATRGPKMALLGASNGFGLVLGPLMASFIVGDGLTHPLFLGGFLAMLALLIVYFGLPQTQVISAAPKATVRLFDPRLRLPMLSAFISMSCVITCQIVVGFFCLDVLHLDNQSAAKVSAQAMASVGVALIFTQIVITKLVYIQPKTWLSTGTLIAAIAMVLMFWVSTPIHLMAVYALIAVGLGMVFPSIQTLAANAVTNSEQGVAAGSLGAAQAMGTCLAPLAATLIYTLSPSLPYLLFGLSLAVLSVFSFYSATDTSAKEMLEN
ncbi:MFS transporter [Agarivorans sp. QJM3NY_33]|uniref:MFS transporter n=1 Tax=Agarivorans sp. QJM3NY_33 TaxID=3421432 RepID=UPI003D7D743A